MSDLDTQIEEILNTVQDYTVESALGGSPFKTTEENQDYVAEVYDKGRTEAHKAIKTLLDTAVKEAMAINRHLEGIREKITGKPEVIREEMVVMSEIAIEYRTDEEILIDKAKVLQLAIENNFKYKLEGKEGTIITIYIPTYNEVRRSGGNE